MHADQCLKTIQVQTCSRTCTKKMLLYPGLMITTENSHVKKYRLEIGEFLG